MLRVLSAGVAVLFLSVAVDQPVHAQAKRVGVEFQVNTVTTNYQARPDAGMDREGDFVVVWMSSPGDGDNYGILRHPFNSAGAPTAGSTVVNTYITSFQNLPAMSMSPDGDYVIVWSSNGQDGSNVGVFARRFDSAGTPLATELQVNQNFTNAQTTPAVALIDNGDFVVVWKDVVTGGKAKARRFNPAGAQGAEFEVGSGTFTNQSNPVVAMSNNGDFVVVYERHSLDNFPPEQFSLSAQRFAANGARIGIEFHVTNINITAFHQRPAIAMDADGDFVVAWQGYAGDGSDKAILARRFNSSGVTQGAQFAANSGTLNFQIEADVAMDAIGRFVIAWQSNLQDGNFTGIFGNMFDATGARQGIEFRINTHTVAAQTDPAIGMNRSGEFVVSWQSYYQDGSYSGIFAQRFALPIALDIDGDGVVQSLTDGILLLRYLFGFTGATLINGAVDNDCTRCGDAAVLAYLNSIRPGLDFDGDGELEPLTDGLLSLRFLFGFTGSTLITGVVDADCTRCDAPAIEALLAPMI